MKIDTSPSSKYSKTVLLLAESLWSIFAIFTNFFCTNEKSTIKTIVIFDTVVLKKYQLQIIKSAIILITVYNFIILTDKS